MVTLRNQADELIHGARKAVEDAGDTASEEERLLLRRRQPTRKKP